MELKEQGRGSAGSAELDSWEMTDGNTFHCRKASLHHAADSECSSQSEANNNQLLHRLNILWSHKSLQVKAPRFLTQDRFEILPGTGGWSLMERSLVRIGDCSEVGRCFIMGIFCALLIYIERESGNGQAGREAAGEENKNKVLKELGRKSQRMVQS